jgi:16S rRNA (guanine(966)-N(2))-methyltransferase RsmD
VSSRRGSLRIIAGELRGRRIAVPPGPAVRPTADRVREALFSILGALVPGARVLDAYSGSGALGLEALSRGARSVQFVEADRDSWRTLLDNVDRLGVRERASVLFGSVARVLRGDAAHGPFDLVLADPPYAESEAETMLPCAARLLAPGGLLVIERDARSVPPDAAPFGLERFRSASYGRARLDFYRPVPGTPAPGEEAYLEEGEPRNAPSGDADEP